MISRRLLTIALLTVCTIPAYSMGDTESATAFNAVMGLLELPFLGIALVFSFLNAQALKGGKFGKGMSYLAWGFMVMAVGHLHMQLDYHFGINIFNSLLGVTGGQVAWFLALVVTWGLSGLGFYQIWKVSKS